jgi:hypothetical protein
VNELLAKAGQQSRYQSAESQGIEEN